MSFVLTKRCQAHVCQLAPNKYSFWDQLSSDFLTLKAFVTALTHFTGWELLRYFRYIGFRNLLM